MLRLQQLDCGEMLAVKRSRPNIITLKSGDLNDDEWRALLVGIFFVATQKTRPPPLEVALLIPGASVPSAHSPAPAAVF